MTDTRWEPPLAGTEVEHLVGMLDRLRATFRWKADGLDHDGLATRIGASALSLGSLLSHLAAVEDDVFSRRLTGEQFIGPWGAYWSPDDPDWTFAAAAKSGPAELYALWDDAVERSRQRLRAALEQGGLDQLVALETDDGRHASLRRIVCDLVEEYGRHTGHADLLREAVDGRVGEDVPPGWAPVSSARART